MDWTVERNRLEKASSLAEAILEGLNLLSVPVSPEAVAACEPNLTVCGDAFGDQFDGQLEYHRAEGQFLLFYNNRYDQGREPGNLHPRTRFSIGHELGHYHLPEHHNWLMTDGISHKSRSEFKSQNIIEREADAFASGLLLPSQLVSPLLNHDELTLDMIEDVAEKFKASRVATAIRATRLSEFTNAVVGIRDGKIAWWSYSDPLTAAGCYPIGRQSLSSDSAQAAWKNFIDGTYEKRRGLASGQDWFQTFEQSRLDDVSVTEHYLSVPTMNTLVVLLTVPEDEIHVGDDDDDDDGDVE